MVLHQRLRHMILACAFLLLLAACSHSSTPRAAEGTTAAAAATTANATAPAGAVAQGGGVLYIRTSGGQSAPKIAVVDAASGRRLRELPDGVVAPDGTTIYATTLITGGGSAHTELNAIDRVSGQTLRMLVLDGAYSLPAVAPGSPAGISPDGRTLVLASTAQTDTQRRFVVLDSSLSQPPKAADLDGTFWFDAIGNGDAGLYLIELQASQAYRSPSETYTVRRYDLATGALDAGAVADKTRLEVMSGMRVAAVASPEGDWLYSLYIGGADGPFIHALNVSQRFAVCIDLPAGSGPDGSFESQLLWSLALTPDGRTLYAANGASGTVAEIDTQGLNVRRSKSVAKGDRPDSGILDRLARWLVPAAEAKRLLARGAALSPDGRMLYVVAEKGLLAIRTGDLALRGRYLTDEALDSVSFSRDGRRLYVAAGERSTVQQLDPATGAVLHELKLAGWPSEVL